MTDQQRLPAPPVHASGRAGRLRSLNVLVVDDHEDSRELLAMILEGAGAKVTQAESVSVALQAVAANDFGVLVSDIGMPGEDGYALISRLRSASESPERRAIPAVAVTAFSAPEDRNRVLAAGFQAYLSKPVDVEALVDVVARLAQTAVSL